MSMMAARNERRMSEWRLPYGFASYTVQALQTGVAG